MPLFFPVEIRVNGDSCFRYTGCREHAHALHKSVEYAFGPNASFSVLPEGDLPTGFLPDGFHDPRPFMAGEPTVVVFVADDGQQGKGYFTGFDIVPTPIEIVERRYYVGQEGVPPGRTFPLLVFWDAWKGSGDVPGSVPSGLSAAKWRHVLLLGVGEVFYWGEEGSRGSIKRVRDAQDGQWDDHALYCSPESDDPDSLHRLNELWQEAEKGKGVAFDGHGWAALAALAPGERFGPGGDDQAGTGVLERVT